jgi:hypothetical protein
MMTPTQVVFMSRCQEALASYELKNNTTQFHDTRISKLLTQTSSQRNTHFCIILLIIVVSHASLSDSISSPKRSVGLFRQQRVAGLLAAVDPARAASREGADA